LENPDVKQLFNISDMVRTHARLRPHDIGAMDSRRSLSFDQWNQRADLLAAGLLSQGLSPGERVAVLAHNCVEWMEIYVALARAGLVALPINFRLVGHEIAYILGDAQAAALLCTSLLQDKVQEVLPTLGLKACVQMGGATHAGWLDYDSLIAQATLPAQWPQVQPKDTCALMYTSGTTGKPKGAIRSHEASTLIAYATAMEMGFTKEDKALLVMPLCHANSLYFANTFMHLGACIVIDDSVSFDPARVMHWLSSHSITFTSLVPTHYIMMLALSADNTRQYATGSVARLLISSAPANESLKRDIQKLFPNGQLYELYGSTEAGWVTLLRPEDQLTKLGSVGREWAGSGPIKIMDENRQEVADGEIGELYSCTPYAFEGYWNAPEKTRQAYAGAWCSVGDMAHRDPDGFIWLMDRKSNMIISGGENIYPSEVEAVLCAHPAVQEAAVIGVPHDKWGETVLAVVVTKAGQDCSADALKQWCKEHLAGFKQPRQIEFISAEDMPRTATGKIVHRRLRDLLAPRLTETATN
jgi:acyl-CoA synthetase (AMP-forming)/AMP-acid ligase II